MAGSNCRPPGCHPGALPAELTNHASATQPVYHIQLRLGNTNLPHFPLFLPRPGGGLAIRLAIQQNPAFLPNRSPKVWQFVWHLSKIPPFCQTGSAARHGPDFAVPRTQPQRAATRRYRPTANTTTPAARSAKPIQPFFVSFSRRKTRDSMMEITIPMR